METVQDLAIVLKSIRYQDRHRIVTALTENHGQISALARNSIQSKRFGGTLDLFAASRWTFTRRPNATLHQLTEASIKQPFEGLRKDFHKLSLASVLTEFLLIMTPPQEACPELFKLHSNALWILEEIDFKDRPGAPLALLNIYLIKLLQWSGNQPPLDNCAQCGKLLSQEVAEQNFQLHGLLENGGWSCRNCGGSRTYLLDARALQEVQLGLSQPLRKTLETVHTSEENHRHLFRFLEAFFLYHIPGFDQHPLKSLRFLGLESSLPLPGANPQ